MQRDEKTAVEAVGSQDSAELDPVSIRGARRRGLVRVSGGRQESLPVVPVLVFVLELFVLAVSGDVDVPALAG